MRVFLLIALALAGCTSETSSDAPDPSGVPDATPLAFDRVPTFDMAGRSAPRSGGVDMADIDARQAVMESMRGAMDLRFELSDGMNRATDWREAEAMADRLLPQLPEPFRWSAEQDAALQMVHRLTSLSTLDAQSLDALGEYTQTLGRSGSTEGDDVLRALIRLDGHWDATQRGDVARSAARSLGAVFAGEAECVGCTVEEALAGMLPQRRASLEPLLYDIQTVHRELVRLARVGAGVPPF